MSKETSQSIKRQWQILLYLQMGAYVSTNDIRDYLNQQGISAELRTIQRDLNQLEHDFPLECRRDSMPHSWRWKRNAESLEIPMTTTQAATFLLIESQLRDVIPKKMYVNLQPFFVMAKRKVGLNQDVLPALQHKVLGAVIGGVADITSRGKKMPQLWDILGGILTPSLSEKKTWLTTEQENQLTELMTVLQTEGLESLILEIKALAQSE